MDLPASSFLLKADIEVYETTRGFIARTAEQNQCFGRVRDFISNLYSIRSNLPKLASLTETSCEILRAHGSICKVIGEGSDEFRIGDERFDKSLIYSTSNRVCPLCFSADGISRVYWDFRKYTVCHIHGCKLIRQCTACDRDIGWDLPRRRCRCGLEIEAMKSTISAGSVERGLCGLLALATLRSLRPWTPSTVTSPHDRGVSLHWHLLLFDFVQSVLIPCFLEEFDIPGVRLKESTLPWLTLKILEDPSYCLQLREAVFLHAASSPFTFKKAVSIKKKPEETRQLLQGCLEDLPFHRILWDWKNETGLSACDLAAIAEIPCPVEVRRERPTPELGPISARYRPKQRRINLGMVGTTHDFSSW